MAIKTNNDKIYIMIKTKNHMVEYKQIADITKLMYKTKKDLLKEKSYLEKRRTLTATQMIFTPNFYHEENKKFIFLIVPTMSNDIFFIECEVPFNSSSSFVLREETIKNLHPSAIITSFCFLSDILLLVGLSNGQIYLSSFSYLDGEIIFEKISDFHLEEDLRSLSSLIFHDLGDGQGLLAVKKSTSEFSLHKIFFSSQNFRLLDFSFSKNFSLFFGSAISCISFIDQNSLSITFTNGNYLVGHIIQNENLIVEENFLTQFTNKNNTFFQSLNGTAISPHRLYSIIVSNSVDKMNRSLISLLFLQNFNEKLLISQYQNKNKLDPVWDILRTLKIKEKPSIKTFLFNLEENFHSNQNKSNNACLKLAFVIRKNILHEKENSEKLKMLLYCDYLEKIFESFLKKDPSNTTQKQINSMAIMYQWAAKINQKFLNENLMIFLEKKFEFSKVKVLQKCIYCDTEITFNSSYPFSGFCEEKHYMERCCVSLELLGFDVWSCKVCGSKFDKFSSEQFDFVSSAFPPKTCIFCDTHLD
eukprot:TRINITY_DN2009_c0_g1_i2.p1 TRINITY_DN2009_c0_g1~~TRINITY_DN2009_c0_g1_i2.p1  ORF type:complete len:530 (+),score=153.16 TRINITY_DN2009_c0_g1_i2:306-1895(+)